MNSKGLIGAVKKRGGYTNEGAAHAVETVVASITHALLEGEEITIMGFGKFTVVDTPARTGRNPRTGEPLEIPAGRKVKFKLSPNLLVS